jgi:membrane protease YdiL (CAAX protease family)
MSRTRRKATPRYPFYTGFRRHPPPWVLTLLMLAAMVFFDVMRKKPAEETDFISESILYSVEQDLLRMEAPPGLDTMIDKLFQQDPSGAVLRLLQHAQDRHHLNRSGLWMKATVELELGDAAAARKTMESFDAEDSALTDYLTSIADGTPPAGPVRAGMRVFVKRMPASWWIMKLARRLDLAEEMPERERELKEKAEDVRTARVRAALVDCAILLTGLAGLPVLWRMIRRGVPGRPLALPPGMPSTMKAVAGAFAIAGITGVLLDMLATPALSTWWIPMMQLFPKGWAQVAFLWITFAALLMLPALLPAWIMGRLCDGRLRLAFRYAGARLRQIFHRRTIIAGAALFLCILCASLVTGRLLIQLGFRSDYLDSFSRYRPGSGTVLQYLTAGLACLVAPLAEEIVYRGYLLEGFKRTIGFWPAALISSVAFSAAHHYSASHAILTFLFGLMLCRAMHRTGRLSICIVAHALWNLVWILEAVS